MTSSRQRRPGTDDLADDPILDDAERAESRWLLARQREPGAPAPSSKIASDYAKIDDLLATLRVGVAQDSWHEDVLRVARRRARSRWLRTGAAVVVAAAAAVWLLTPRSAIELEVAIQHDDQKRKDSTSVAVGDRLVITARPRGTGDLRVYQSSGALVARCPGGPACRTPAPGEYVIDITLDVPAEYRVFLVVGASDAPAAAPVDAYLETARAANARILSYRPIVVR